MFKKTFGLALTAAAAQAGDITAVWNLLTASGSFFPQFDFWTYFLLSLQDDTTDTSSTCFDDFYHYRELYEHVETLVADSTDYVAGLTDKGNGLTISGNSFAIGNIAGFVMYQITNIADVVVEFVEVYHGCRLDYYMLSVGKALTSVPGFLNTGTNFLWRTLSNDDSALYDTLQTAIDNTDYAGAGSAFGEWIKIFLMADIPSEAEASSYYQYVSYLAA